MNTKYFGNWADRDSVADDFYPEYHRKYSPLPSDFPTDAEIVFAEYETPSYDGVAFMLFERDGKLFEVNGSHCSCNGLEGQWEPEETTWTALAMRPDKKPMYDSDVDAIAAYRNLIHAHTAQEAQ